MSTVFTNGSNGYYRTPVSKVLLGTVAVSHAFVKIPFFESWKNFTYCQIPGSIIDGEFWRILSCKLTFVESKDAFFALILIHYFRIFERRYGSRKFSSQLIVSFVMSLIIECFFTYTLQRYYRYIQYEFTGGILSKGPLGLILPWFVPFYIEIPPLLSGTIAAYLISPKMIAYLLGLQLIGSSTPNIITAVACLLSAYLYRSNFLWIQTRLQIPSFVSKLASRLFGWVESSKPMGGIMGATLDIQRTLFMEYSEQQRLRAQLRQHGIRHMGMQGFGERLVEDDGWGRRFQNFPSENMQPSEENIRILMDMGFNRSRVVEALRQSNNDIQTASAVLLRDV